MSTEKEGFDILWRPEPNTLLIHEGIYEYIEPIRRVFQLISCGIQVPLYLSHELRSIAEVVFGELGSAALSWFLCLLTILSIIVSKETDLGSFGVESPMFVFDHSFGSDATHRVRTDTQ